jgi:hypothetical protein
LNEFPDQISDTFIKSFEQLSPQIPIYSTVLALLHNVHKQTEFTTLVLQKIQSNYIQHLSQGRIVTAKLLLRVLVCLTCCKAFALEGSGSMLEILESLYLVIENGLPATTEEELSEDSAQCAFLLASGLIWSLESNGGVFHESAAARAFLDKSATLFRSILESYASPFAVNGCQAMLHRYSLPETDEGDEQSVPLGLGVHGAKDGNSSWKGCYDTVWESLTVCIHVIEHGLQSSCGESNPLPRGMLRPWTAIEIEQVNEEETEPVAPLRFSDEFESQFLGLLDSSANENDGTMVVEDVVNKGGLGIRAKFSVPLTSGGHVAIGEANMYGRGYGWNFGKIVFFTSETNEKVQELASTMTAIEKYLLTQYYYDVLCYFDPIINDDGTKLGSLDLLVNHLFLGINNLFNGPEPKASSNDMEADGSNAHGRKEGGDDENEETNQEEVKEKKERPTPLSLEYVLVETLFQLLLLQPANTAHSLFISRVILLLCKKYSTIAPIVALATSVLYLLLPDFNASAIINQITDWFVFHLINTQFVWPFWDFMLDEAGLLSDGGEISEGKVEKNEIQAVYFAFFEAMCSRLQLLIGVEQYKNSLPRELVALFPFTEQSAVPSSPYFTRSRDIGSVSSGVIVTVSKEEKHFIGALFHQFTTNEKIRTFAHQMKSRLQSRMNCDELIEWLESLPPLAEEVK